MYNLVSTEEFYLSQSKLKDPFMSRLFDPHPAFLVSIPTKPVNMGCSHTEAVLSVLSHNPVDGLLH